MTGVPRDRLELTSGGRCTGARDGRHTSRSAGSRGGPGTGHGGHAAVGSGQRRCRHSRCSITDHRQSVRQQRGQRHGDECPDDREARGTAAGDTLVACLALNGSGIAAGGVPAGWSAITVFDPEQPQGLRLLPRRGTFGARQLHLAPIVIGGQRRRHRAIHGRRHASHRSMRLPPAQAGCRPPPQRCPASPRSPLERCSSVAWGSTRARRASTSALPPG